MKIMLKAALLALFTTGIGQAAFWSSPTGTIGVYEHRIMSGKLYKVNAYVYDYVGGTQIYGISLVEGTGIPGKQDLNALSGLLLQAYTNWDRVRVLMNTGSTPGYITSGLDVSIYLSK